ncbi:MAG: T9SS type A sorting domain-containing protein [Sphingobacteriaceae bacterium]|nr:T9SS type A sorting domain-containing protein [Sphingobacteriaceae bacterium]
MKNLFYIKFFLLLPLLHICQTGPAGVLTSANNVLWLKADVETFSDGGVTPSVNGGLVEQWNDQSGNGINAIEVNGTNQPTLVTAIFNNQPVLRFDGTNDRILASGVTTSSSVATVFVVTKYTSLGSSNPGIAQGSPVGQAFSTTANNKSIGIWINSANSIVWGRGVQTNNTQCNISQVTVVNPNTGYIIANRYNGAGTINQYVSNAAAGNVAYNSTLKSWTEFGIGRQGAETLNGDIAEVIVYNASVNHAQRHIIDNYLSSKYNLPLSSNDFYAGDTPGNGDYDFEVAGVGQDASGGNNSAASSISGGLDITQNVAFGNGEYLLYGHQTGTNTVDFVDIGGMSAGPNRARWSRIWYLDWTHVGGTNESVNLTFDYTDVGTGGLPVAPLSNYKLLYRAGLAGAWTEVMNASSIVGDRVSFNGLVWNTQGDGYYTIGTLDHTQSPLPITLLNFNAKNITEGALINWSTAQEKNSSHFELEKSENGIDFVNLAKINSKAFNGNSSAQIDYEFIDLNQTSDVNYYRLKQVDFDGTYSFSQIVSLLKQKEKNAITFSIYPNPNHGEFKVDIHGIENNHRVNLFLHDLQGKLIYSNSFLIQKANSGHFNIIPENKLENGIYLCTLKVEEISFQIKVVVN